MIYNHSTRPLSLLATQVEPIVKGLQKQLLDKDDKTRQSCFSLLGDLVNVLPGCLAPYVDILMPPLHKSMRYYIIYFILETTKTLSFNGIDIIFMLNPPSAKGASCYIKISSLVFLRTLLTQHNPDIFQPYLTETLSCVIGAVQDTFYKVGLSFSLRSE